MGNKESRLDELSDKSVAKIQSQMGFKNVNVKAMYAAFKAVKKNSLKLSKQEFTTCIQSLFSSGLKKLDSSDIEKLYATLDTSKDGNVDLLEAISGLALLCGGSNDDKIEVFFELYDLDGNGSISKEELEKMVYTAWINAFKALEVSHGDGSDATNMVLGMMESMCQDLAKQFASQCFAVLDENKDGVLSLQEFKKFATADPKVTAKLNGFTKEAKLVNL